MLKWIAAAYVEFIRNTPLIVQLFFIAFGLPMLLGYEWPFWAHALLSLHGHSIQFCTESFSVCCCMCRCSRRGWRSGRLL